MLYIKLLSVPCSLSFISSSFPPSPLSPLPPPSSPSLPVYSPDGCKLAYCTWSSLCKCKSWTGIANDVHTNERMYIHTYIHVATDNQLQHILCAVQCYMPCPVHHCNIFGDSVSHNALDLRCVCTFCGGGDGGRGSLSFCGLLLLPGIGQRSNLLECLD